MKTRIVGRNDKSEQMQNYDVNENFLNIITPAGIDFDSMHTSLGENVGKMFAIVTYSAHPDFGWLSPLCNMEGTSTVIEYHSTDPAKLKRNFDSRVINLQGEYETLRKESERQANEKAVKDLMQMINRICVQQEPVGYIVILFHIQDTNEERLNERIKRVRSLASIYGCNMKLLKYKQGKGLKVIAPYGIPDFDVSKMGERNMPLETFFGGFPMANPGINDERGYYLGKTKNNKLVILDQWLRNKDRVNSNWTITGLPGVGKSTALKTILTKEFAFGTRIIMFDPEREYVDLAKHPDINGKIVNCVGGNEGRINPLQIRFSAKINEDDLEPNETMEDFFSYEEALDSSDMALYIQQLKVFFTMYFGKEEMVAGIRAILEQSIIELYEKNGITWNTDISKLKNTDYPIMKDLYELVKEKSIQKGLSPYKKQNYEKLLDLLYSAGEGADRLWNGPTTVDADSNFVDLITAGLLEADENVKRAQFYNIITWVWNIIINDRTEKVLFGIDEGYLVVDPEMIELMKFIRNISKRIRKYEGSLMFITHSIVDLLDTEVKRLGQGIIDNACYKFIMGCDGKNLKETAELFNLSDHEISILGQKNRGQGVFMAGNIRLDLTVDVSDEFLAMFGTAGGR